MNSLESYIVDTQDKLYSEEFELVSTEDERSKLRQSLSDSSEWLYEDGFNADTKVRDYIRYAKNRHRFMFIFQ